MGRNSPSSIFLSSAIILPGKPIIHALAKLNCPRLHRRRDSLYEKTVGKIACGGNQSRYLPQTRASTHEFNTLRNNNHFSIFIAGQIDLKTASSSV